MKFITHLLVSAVAIAVAAYILPGVHIATATALIIFTLILALINAFVRPVLKVLTLPLTVLTLGIFSLILNALLILLADKIVDGITIDGFLWALLFGILISIVHGLLHVFEGKDSHAV
jgi:putative membrane protein